MFLSWSDNLMECFIIIFLQAVSNQLIVIGSFLACRKCSVISIFSSGSLSMEVLHFQKDGPYDIVLFNIRDSVVGI